METLEVLNPTTRVDDRRNVSPPSWHHHLTGRRRRLLLLIAEYEVHPPPQYLSYTLYQSPPGQAPPDRLGIPTSAKFKTNVNHGTVPLQSDKMRFHGPIRRGATSSELMMTCFGTAKFSSFFFPLVLGVTFQSLLDSPLFEDEADHGFPGD